MESWYWLPSSYFPHVSGKAPCLCHFFKIQNQARNGLSLPLWVWAISVSLHFDNGLVGYKVGWLLGIVTVFDYMTLSFWCLRHSPQGLMILFDKYRNKLLALNTGGMYIDERDKDLLELLQYMVVELQRYWQTSPTTTSQKMNWDSKPVAIDYNHEVVKSIKQNGIQHQLRIAAIASLGIHWISPWVGLFSSEFPWKQYEHLAWSFKTI